jgi:hypothetical protein
MGEVFFIWQAVTATLFVVLYEAEIQEKASHTTTYA